MIFLGILVPIVSWFHHGALWISQSLISWTISVLLPASSSTPKNNAVSHIAKPLLIFIFLYLVKLLIAAQMNAALSRVSTVTEMCISFSITNVWLRWRWWQQMREIVDTNNAADSITDLQPTDGDNDTAANVQWPCVRLIDSVIYFSTHKGIVSTCYWLASHNGP